MAGEADSAKYLKYLGPAIVGELVRTTIYRKLGVAMVTDQEPIIGFN